jgi:hypothetical protein
MGADQPFAGRLRAAGTLRAWGQTRGTPETGDTRVSEVRMDLAVAYSPLPWLTLAAQLPLQRREVLLTNLARQTAWGVGDAELSARAVLWRDRLFAPRLLVSALGGVKLPTAPLPRTAQGLALADEAWLGSGGLEGQAGLSVLGFAGPWSGLLSLTGVVAGSGYQGFQAGAALHTSLFAQRHLLPWLAMRLGTDARLSAADQHPHAGPAGGGLLAQAAPDVLFGLPAGGVLQVGARLPFLVQLSGGVRPSPLLQATLAYDL